MFKTLKKLTGSESGATAIEYGLIAALIAVAIIFGVSQLGNTLGDTFNSINGKLG